MEKIKREILENIDNFVHGTFRRMDQQDKDKVTFMITSKDMKSHGLCKVEYFEDYFEVEIVNYFNINESVKFKIEDVL